MATSIVQGREEVSISYVSLPSHKKMKEGKGKCQRTSDGWLDGWMICFCFSLFSLVRTHEHEIRKGGPKQSH